jgi:hypothetical protein
MSSPFDCPSSTTTEINRTATKVPQTREELEQDRIEKARRMDQRRANARDKIANMQPDPSDLERLSMEDLERIYGMAKEEDPLEEKEEYAWLRRLWGKKNQIEFDPYQPAGMATPGGSYGMCPHSPLMHLPSQQSNILHLFVPRLVGPRLSHSWCLHRLWA